MNLKKLHDLNEYLYLKVIKAEKRIVAGGIVVNKKGASDKLV